MRLPVEIVAQCNAALGQEPSEFFGEFLQKHPLIFFRRFNLRPVRHIGNPIFVVHLLSKHHHVRIGAGPTTHPCINVTVAYGEFKSAALHAERRLNTRPESGLLHERRPVDVFDGFGFERKLHGIEMVGNVILLEKENRDKELPFAARLLYHSTFHRKMHKDFQYFPQGSFHFCFFTSLRRQKSFRKRLDILRKTVSNTHLD